MAEIPQVIGNFQNKYGKVTIFFSTVMAEEVHVYVGFHKTYSLEEFESHFNEELEEELLKSDFVEKLFNEAKKDSSQGAEPTKNKQQIDDRTFKFTSSVELISHRKVKGGEVSVTDYDDDAYGTLGINFHYSDKPKARIPDDDLGPGYYTITAGHLIGINRNKVKVRSQILMDGQLVAEKVRRDKACDNFDAAIGLEAGHFKFKPGIQLFDNAIDKPRQIIDRGIEVQKFGRETFLTNGKVVSTNCFLRVKDDTHPSKSFLVDQQVIETSCKWPFGTNGDSGAVVLSVPNNKDEMAIPLGILFAKLNDSHLFKIVVDYSGNKKTDPKVSSEPRHFEDGFLCFMCSLYNALDGLGFGNMEAIDFNFVQEDTKRK